MFCPPPAGNSGAETSFSNTVQPGTGLRPNSSRYGPGDTSSTSRRTASGFSL